MSKHQPQSSPCHYSRREAISVPIGGIPLGFAHPIRLQSMASVSTMDTEASVAQAERIIEAGADYIRFTAQGRKEATNLGEIRARLRDLGYSTPLIADIHFNPSAADEALERIEKVRVNPGNYVDTKVAGDRVWTEELFAQMHQRVEERFGAFVERAKELGRTLRIGVNHGSLSERMVMLHGDTPEGMVQSCLEYLDVCQKHDFHNIVISMKASNTTVMTSAVRLLAKRLEEGGCPAYPLHLGVTEAGEGEDGRVKSAVGIGSLLADGLGDTIRVSLSEDPELEIPVGRALVDYIGSRPLLPEETKTLQPSWAEYDQLRSGARLRTYKTGKLVGGDNLPIVLALAEARNALAQAETKPDYYVDRSGTVSLASADAKINDFSAYYATYKTIDESFANELQAHPERIIILETTTDNPIAEWRLGVTMLARLGLQNPIILAHCYETSDLSLFRLQAAADAGTLLLDGWGSGLMLTAPNLPAEEVIKTQLGILQATRLRMSKTEFISCPSCGRTLYNLQETIARIKASTSHLKGLKIGIMGCIVNGPGEMADADYGYVGAAPGKIDLYKGQTCVRKGIDQGEALEQLVELIKSEGDWQDPE